ncbi:FliA/WhiG family RNA polymerase sigma factor [Bacillus capparidis]|uniref:RNA polymerase sigma factor for flagellar operon FliA n=1 Tax=Bacillus capparidis TaxID=1840411 RepID=A0ABS4CSC3_9BACI|nr:FliA/WhiG family RNA polymerase sigma factor [Bacillus capparidis]MBP1080039.1 RNA polymerase sigma factor for flagellar operon FliA [Bacillus capparidis]MED1095428.1 FliA/WhiG family RNA polymerase sigma factor [Bacillus capparidis]
MQSLRSEDQLLWSRWKEWRDRNAGDDLIRKYMPLVTYHVGRISVGLPKSVHKDDLTSLGLMGLYDALEKFDPGRDLKFDTYASFRIRGAIIDGLRKEDWLPRTSREKTKKVDVAIERLEQRYLRNVTPDEIAKELGMTQEDVVTTINEGFFANLLSIDDKLHDQDEGENIQVMIRDHNEQTPEEKIVKAELIEQLSDQIRELSEKEQIVISLFYKEELTLTEIGQVLKLSTSRISQIHSKALFKLKHLLEKAID